MQYTIDSLKDNFSKKFQSARLVLKILARKGLCSAGDIGEECGISLPSVAKLLDDLMTDGFVKDLGQQHKEGGRMPHMYALNPDKAYFAGVELNANYMRLGIMGLDGGVLYKTEDDGFRLREEMSAEDIAAQIAKLVKGRPSGIGEITAYVISLPGRVNTRTGESFNFFAETSRSTEQILGRELGARVFIDNDSRIMCYGEYLGGKHLDVKNMIYVNLAWGLGTGMILNGELFYGKTGFSGELGHVSMFENEVFCRCGKKGCLETEASGWAAYRQLIAKHNAGARSTLSGALERGEKVSPEEMVRAVAQGDMLMIEVMEDIGAKLGRGIAAMVNLLNPELIVLGGTLAETGELLLASTVSSVRKYSINIVNRETPLILNSCGRNACITGACRLARDRFLGLV